MRTISKKLLCYVGLHKNYHLESVRYVHYPDYEPLKLLVNLKCDDCDREFYWLIPLWMLDKDVLDWSKSMMMRC